MPRVPQPLRSQAVANELLGRQTFLGNILSGGITGINDDALKAFGMGNNTTLGALNDAMKHGPLETSLEQGRPASIGALTKDRNQRLGQDSTGSARTIGDIAALVGMAFGGAAAAGGSAGSGAAGAAGTGAGSTAGTAASTGATGAASSGGWMGGLKSVGQAAGSAQQVQGLLAPQQPPVSSSSVPVGNGSAMGEVYAQIQQQELQRQQQEMQMRQQRRGLLGNGG